jgi:hypothetical protein
MTVRSSASNGRASTRTVMSSIRPSKVRPPFLIAFVARWRAASTNCGSFMVTSACSGVLVGIRFTVQTKLSGASKVAIEG